ncbi:MAG: ROK family protein [Clostridia bacterium]|nr:ROK family protein [Clostridia bacterium]
MKLGALEAGGTKMVCVIGDENGNIFERVSFPTKLPHETMPAMIDFFKSRGIEALGIGSFGPLCLDKKSPEYGNITTTPKLDWRNYPLTSEFAKELGVPVGIDTDVNAAALGEAMFGAGKGCDTVVYYTIGTGVGGGVLAEGRLHHGMIHPEMGHMMIRPHEADPAPKGFCPYHASCLEGMAAGPAIEKRWGVSAKDLPEDHIAWDVEAEYLAQMCVNTILMFSPGRIILGGGVMHQQHLFPKVRKRTLELLGGYVAAPAIIEHIDEYIVSPGLGDNAGAVGSLMLAKEALA